MNIEEKKWEIMFDEKTISNRIKELGKEISEEYKGKNLLVIALLKGSFVFCADIVRAIELNTLKINFMTTSSYGNSTKSSGNVVVKSDITIDDITDYDVLIVDDISDTANTMDFVLKHMAAKNPRSIKTCVLLDKPSRREVDFVPDFYGFSIEDKFVVGYGLDFADYYRNYPYIFCVTDENR